jgi:hypothetical protein
LIAGVAVGLFNRTGNPYSCRLVANRCRIIPNKERSTFTNRLIWHQLCLFVHSCGMGYHLTTSATSDGCTTRLWKRRRWYYPRRTSRALDSAPWLANRKRLEEPEELSCGFESITVKGLLDPLTEGLPRTEHSPVISSSAI